MFSVSAYVPCFNNAATIVEAARSLAVQTPPVAEIFVIDDGSTDDSAAVAERAGLRVLRQERNLGRGAARARAIEEARGELVLSCDATMALAPDFLEKALPYFREDRVAAVFGRVVDPSPQGVTGRWRARHLLKCHVKRGVVRQCPLSTWGVLMRRSAVIGAGNFNPAHRHSEDKEIGKRLIEAGWQIVFEPAAQLSPKITNTLPQLLERYWRWNVGVEERMSLLGYLRLISYSARSMAVFDLKAGDPAAAAISLLTPHYSLWRWLRKKRKQKAEAAGARKREP